MIVAPSHPDEPVQFGLLPILNIHDSGGMLRVDK